MQFFERQDDARQSTWFLGIVTLVGTVTVAASGGFLLAGLGVIHEAIDPASSVDAGILAGIVALVIMVLAMLVRRVMLGMGADRVPRAVGAVEVPARPEDDGHVRLRNVVAEMALAAQVREPQVFVLETIVDIDAFAAGVSADCASITVSRGCLEQLNRDELQAVIAHEFSHIVNGDIAINLRLISLTAGLRLFWTVGAGIVRFAVRITRGKHQLPAFLLATILCSPLLWMGSVGVLFSRIMQAGVSRQREHLADASAVQYTRNAAGLIGALKKAAVRSQYAEAGQRIRNGLVSHMLFVGRRHRWYSLLATHPRIERRIALLSRHSMGD